VRFFSLRCRFEGGKVLSAAPLLGDSILCQINPLDPS
jgi:hypothetical protein